MNARCLIVAVLLISGCGESYNDALQRYESERKLLNELIAATAIQEEQFDEELATLSRAVSQAESRLQFVEKSDPAKIQEFKTALAEATKNRDEHHDACRAKLLALDAAVDAQKKAVELAAERRESLKP